VGVCESAACANGIVIKVTRSDRRRLQALINGRNGTCPAVSRHRLAGLFFSTPDRSTSDMLTAPINSFA